MMLRDAYAQDVGFFKGRADSLKVEADLKDWRITMLEDQKLRWYEKPLLNFVAGAVVMAFLYSATVHLSF